MYLHTGPEKVKTQAKIKYFFFLSFSLLFGWQLSIGIVSSHPLTAVQLSAPVFLATCFKYCSRGLHILLLQGCLLQTRYA
jgi:hypothetical protein